ncbi:MAG: universal stress protein [Methanosarcinales archaeon]|nr:universal stress protein [Methanosarcinales archaeon]
MFERILFPTDFSRYSVKILEGLEGLPGADEVVLVHVVDATRPSIAGGLSYQTRVEEAKAQLGLQAKYLQGRGLKARALVVATTADFSGPDGADLQSLKSHIAADLIIPGDVPFAIAEVARREGLPLLVMGARGRGKVKGILLGSVSRDMLRQSECDLLIMRQAMLEEKGEEEFSDYCRRILSRVVLTTDFSPAAGAALESLKTLPGPGEVALVHVVSRGETEEEIEGRMVEAAKKLQDLRRELEGPGIRATVHVDSGNPAERIVALAARVEATMIMMSSQGKGWLQELRVGSTAFDVARMADMPVLVVRAGEPQE